MFIHELILTKQMCFCLYKCVSPNSLRSVKDGLRYDMIYDYVCENDLHSIYAAKALLNYPADSSIYLYRCKVELCLETLAITFKSTKSVTFCCYILTQKSFFNHLQRQGCSLETSFSLKWKIANPHRHSKYASIKPMCVQ